jgi:hypothetical protein
MIWQAVLAIVIIGAIGFVLVVIPACIVSGRISRSEEQRDKEV